MKIGRAGNGNKIHVVSEFIRPADGMLILGIYCGAQQFNGSGNGQLRRVSEYDRSKVTCKNCIKRIEEMEGK